MIDALFNKLSFYNFHGDLLRNIKSIRKTQNLFDDLSEDPADQNIAIQTELDTKLPFYTDIPIIKRPYEEAKIFNAIGFPFFHFNQSRYSAGHFGVWYGAIDLKVTVYETVFHWKKRLLDKEGFAEHPSPIISERKVFSVQCNARIIDFRPKLAAFQQLLDPENYEFSQNVGNKIKQENYPGLVTRSVRCKGDVFAIFNPDPLSNPRDYCFLSYSFNSKTKKVIVERNPGQVFMKI